MTHFLPITLQKPLTHFLENVDWAYETTTGSKKGLEKWNKFALETIKTAGLAFSSIGQLTAFKPVVAHLRAVKGICELTGIVDATIRVLSLKWGDSLRDNLLNGGEAILGFGASACDVLLFIRDAGIDQLAFLGEFGANLGSYSVLGFVANIGVFTVKNAFVIVICAIDLTKIGIKVYNNYAEQEDDDKNLMQALVDTCWNKSTMLTIAGDMGKIFLCVFAGPAASLGIQVVSLGTQAIGYALFLEKEAVKVAAA